MKIIDLHDPERVNRNPDDIKILLQTGNFIQDEFTISKIELRLYTEKLDPKNGNYSLITSFVQTDKGSVEMIYDEGFLGNNVLSRAFTFLTTNLGLSALVLRSIISIRGNTSK
ncbi:MAG: hypothetical protein JW390_10068 [Nitrosopumilus sp.]|nr:hypothetical protein [Candidatus Nitrosopumilus limneticus]MDC4215584.1 hypothetical protein [Candidatus Nitrosopumilus limneticus]